MTRADTCPSKLPGNLTLVGSNAAGGFDNEYPRSDHAPLAVDVDLDSLT